MPMLSFILVIVCGLSEWKRIGKGFMSVLSLENQFLRGGLYQHTLDY